MHGKVRRRLFRAIVVSIGAIPLVWLLLVVYVVQGYWMPAQLYSLAGVGSVDIHNRTQPGRVAVVPSRLRAETLRDIAFTAYHIAPCAQVWMKRLPISFASEGIWAGAYDPNSQSVAIRMPQINLILHEYAHANFERKPLWDKMAFVLDLAKMGPATDSDHRLGRPILNEELATAVYYGRRGVSYNPILEYYAHLAELSEGDLRAIPAALQRYFADYLQPDDNRVTVKIGQADF